MAQKHQDISISHRKDLLMELKQLQVRDGHIPRKIIAEAARSLNIPINDVFGVASFYSFFSIAPQGRHVIRICQSIPCYLKDSPMITTSVKQEIGIEPGEITADGRFSFELVNCIGACDKAPAMLVDNDVHGHLTPDMISEILKTYE